ncbi:4'-phosphopantetheinyl transferase family protein [Acinetobacter sp. A47]|uniref:4'-phosphopantetheinyl transferase family protein n=1 Tax=Acinetobacter sp. A47 TaxID=1561217 RepID=UPI000571AA8D|nr:4'-phosphopantetheinyl transferase superfamily protein [Acinetobacter sp. A47]
MSLIEYTPSSLRGTSRLDFVQSVICYQTPIDNFLKNQAYLTFEKPKYLEYALTSRIKEFWAGRLLAEEILKKYFDYHLSITHKTSKLPQWPKGTVGCISHTYDYVIAAVSSESKYLGIDMEYIVDKNVLEESKNLVLTISEQSFWELKYNKTISFCEYFTLVFSLKESLYKAVYPLAKKYIDFLEVTVIELDFEKKEAFLKFNRDIEYCYGLLSRYKGFWFFEKGRVITCIEGKTLC